MFDNTHHFFEKSDRCKSPFFVVFVPTITGPFIFEREDNQKLTNL